MNISPTHLGSLKYLDSQPCMVVSRQIFFCPGKLKKSPYRASFPAILNGKLTYGSFRLITSETAELIVRVDAMVPRLQKE